MNFSKKTLPLLLLALAGCGPEFKPASYVDKLRVLGIQAEPPELEPLPAAGEDPAGRPPDRARITSLIADPAQLTETGREVTVVYLACTPDPLDPTGGACTAIANLRDPAGLGSLLGGPGGSVPGCDGGGGGSGGGGGAGGGGGPPPAPGGALGGISLVGLEVCNHTDGCRRATILLDPSDPGTEVPLPEALYVLPPELRLDTLPAGAPGRLTGLQVTILALAIQASPQEFVAGADLTDPCALGVALPANLQTLFASRENVIAVKRLQIRGPDNTDAPNVNPQLPGITAGGAPLPAVLAEPLPEQAVYFPGQVGDLLPRLPAPPLGEDGVPLPQSAIYQSFTRYDLYGTKLSDETEEWLYSWFTTGGVLDKLRTRGAGEVQAWLAPRDLEDEPIPEGGRVFLYSVVRDVRGGIAWAKREVRVTAP